MAARPVCRVCNKRPAYRKGSGKNGRPYWATICRYCQRASKIPVPKKLTCESCDFVAADPCQMDIDHIDGNHANWDARNLQTLCANCHRLKTKESGDWVSGRALAIIADQLSFLDR